MKRNGNEMNSRLIVTSFMQGKSLMESLLTMAAVV